MTIKLYLDEDVWVGLAAALREKGYDVTAASEVKRKGISDEAQLAYAAEENRAILTHNIKDFVPLAQLYAQENKPHAGIIVANRFEKGELLRRVTDLLEQVSAEAMANTLRFV